MGKSLQGAKGSSVGRVRSRPLLTRLVRSPSEGAARESNIASIRAFPPIDSIAECQLRSVFPGINRQLVRTRPNVKNRLLIASYLLFN